LDDHEYTHKVLYPKEHYPDVVDECYLKMNGIDVDVLPDD